MKDKVIIGESELANAGRGVFAKRKIAKGEVIEYCPILIFDKKDTVNIMKTKLANYVFDYAGERTLFALGYGSLYNHSKKPNARYELTEYEGGLEENNELTFVAIKDIAKGEEIYISYGVHHDEIYG